MNTGVYSCHQMVKIGCTLRGIFLREVNLAVAEDWDHGIEIGAD